jgi:DNA-binding NarL/FixJ family response regulator
VAGKVKALGADGFISKNLPRKDIMKAVDALLQGQKLFPLRADAAGAASTDAEQLLEKLRQLTPQQLKVLYRVCEAKLNKQIAYELGVTETTIKAHVTLIFKKLGVHSRTQAVLMMQRMRPELMRTEFGGLVVVEDTAG